MQDTVPRNGRLARASPLTSASGEFALAAAACVWPPSEARDEAVRRAARVDIDWPTFRCVAARHRVEGLAWRALARAEVSLPGDVADSLRARAGAIARESLLLAAEAARLQGVLDAAGVANLALKGASLDILAYGALGLKDAWDIDLLVAPPSAQPAAEALLAAGYDLAGPAGLILADFAAWTSLAKECLFIHRESGVNVELHWRAVDGAGLLPDLSATSPHQVVVLSPALSLRTLAQGELFAYLCVHGASHGWSRLKWLADLAALVSREDALGLEGLYRRSLGMGAGCCPAQALLLCRRLLSLTLPASLARELPGDIKIRWLEAGALRALTGGGQREIRERPGAGEAIALSHLLFANGWAYRWAEFRRQWIGVHDRRRLRLPAGLHGLYGIIRAPSWIWRRLLPSAAAMRPPPRGKGQRGPPPP